MQESDRRGPGRQGSGGLESGRPVPDMRTSSRAVLAAALRECREDTLFLLANLDEARATVPYRKTINPPEWELGHLGWFQERWCLRRDAGASLSRSLLADADRWYDSNAVAHATRWSLDLPSATQTRTYLARVLDASLEALERTSDDDAGLYFHRLSLFHELMHQEAFAYTWQNLGYPEPHWRGGRALREAITPTASTDPVETAFDAGVSTLGAEPDAGFVFDNEKWRRPVGLASFRIDRAPVSNRAFAAFVESGAYATSGWWDPEYWRHLQREMRDAPLHWQRHAGGWSRAWFGVLAPLEPDAPIVQVSAFEAEAWCRWAGRRLPSEAEWERAAREAGAMRWGDQVWEWTSSRFEPLPGFSADPYAEYSAPWFDTHRVVRGGSFATPRALVDSRFRNFYEPHRNDPFIGFRSCRV